MWSSDYAMEIALFDGMLDGPLVTLGKSLQVECSVTGIPVDPGVTTEGVKLLAFRIAHR